MRSVKIKSYVSKAIKANEAGIEKELAKTAVLVTNQTKRNLTDLKAVDTGQLRASYAWKKNKNGYVVFSNVLHAIYIEFGTRKMSARPAFRTAIDMVTKGLTASKAMAKAMQNSVKKAVPK